jgi:hypothetical protein
MMAESATLKLSPLLIGRIVLADHSPIAVSCSTRTIVDTEIGGHAVDLVLQRPLMENASE